MLAYRAGALHLDDVALPALAARHGTPLYVYSAADIRARYRAFDQAFRATRHTICYSVKANSNLSILKLLAKLGSGFDVVSGGELERVLKAGRGLAKKTVFSGVGKTSDELDAALRAGILLFNVESEAELELLAARADALKKTARIALRVNPDVAASTHPYISTGEREHKFGVPFLDALRLYGVAKRHRRLDVAGISVHIGSQILSPRPFIETMHRLASLIDALRNEGHNIRVLDAGGGLGIEYQHGIASKLGNVLLSDYAAGMERELRAIKNIHLLLEPGRALVGPAGILLTRVLYLKQNGARRFVIVDAAMNDLLRPALYNAHHEIVPVSEKETGQRAQQKYDVVGPVCETGDFLARDRMLPDVAAGDLLAVLDAGAYGMALASNYNSRPRPAEILVDGKKAAVIRKRETIADLTRLER